MKQEPYAWHCIHKNGNDVFIMNVHGGSKPDKSWAKHVPVYLDNGERDLLFKAHAYEMVRADKLQIEVGELKETLEQIATGEIAGETGNHKDTVYVMRQIAKEALEKIR